MAMDPGNSHEDSMAIIENDLPRTFANLDYFNIETKEGEENSRRLRSLLRSFAVYRPDIGYVQGMSYLAGFVLMLGNEFDSFNVFHNIITTP